MTLFTDNAHLTQDGLALILTALADVARSEGWCPPKGCFLAAAHRAKIADVVYSIDAGHVVDLRFAQDSAPNGDPLFSSDEFVGWEEARPFLSIVAAVLVRAGFLYGTTDSFPASGYGRWRPTNGRLWIMEDPEVGSAHTRLAAHQACRTHLEALGWEPGMDWDDMGFTLVQAKNTLARQTHLACPTST